MNFQVTEVSRRFGPEKWKGFVRKYSKKENQLEIELYDLDADISETTNLAEKHPEIVAKLSKLMAEQHTPL